MVEQTINANNDGLQREVGMHHRAEIGDLARRAAEEVDKIAAEEEKRAAAAADAPPAFDDNLASTISKMSWDERHKLVDHALAVPI